MSEAERDRETASEVWQTTVLLDETRSIIILARLAVEKGLGVSISQLGKRTDSREKPRYVEIKASPAVKEILDRVYWQDLEIISLQDAEIGSTLGKPKGDFEGWSVEIRRKVEALWWEARGNRKRASKVLNGLDPLAIEDKKEIIGRVLDRVLNRAT